MSDFMSYTSCFIGPTTALPTPALSPPEAFTMGSRKYEESSNGDDAAGLLSFEEEVRCITTVLLCVHSSSSMLDGLEIQTIRYKQQDSTPIPIQ